MASAHVFAGACLCGMCGVCGYMCTFVRGEDMGVHVWDAHVCVSLACLWRAHVCLHVQPGSSGPRASLVAAQLALSAHPIGSSSDPSLVQVGPCWGIYPSLQGPMLPMMQRGHQG